MSEEIQYSPENRARIEVSRSSIEFHLNQIANVVAATIGAKGHVVRFSVSMEGEGGHDGPIAQPFGRGKSKYCFRYSDGTCGCDITPPGICRACRKGDLD